MKSLPATIHLDLDGGKHIFRAHGWDYSATSDPLFVSGLQRALDFFDKHALRATLFVIAEDLDDPVKRELLREAVRRGHEIASHSLTHRNLCLLTTEEKRREVEVSRERLINELGVKVRGFRAPGFAIDRETLELVALTGYDYDSSLFPTRKYAKRVGVERVSFFPERPLPSSALVELPMPDYRPLPAPFHPSYSLVLGDRYFRLGLRLFGRSDAPLVLLFHLTDFSDPLPKREWPDWKAGLYTLSHLQPERKLAGCESMLERVKANYRVVRTEQVIEEVMQFKSDGQESR